MPKLRLLTASLSSAALISTTGITLSLLVACSSNNVTEEKAKQANALEEIIVTASKKVALADQPMSARVQMVIPPSATHHDLLIPEQNRENYRDRDANSFHVVSEQPVSTFSIDVDTAAYANARRFLNNGSLPPVEAIRSEEFINYFQYDYPTPNQQTAPFSVTTEIAPSPWAQGRHLLHVGLKGYDIEPAELPTANLVFLMDVSGSMNSADKLGLVKTSLKLLSKSLRAQDRVSIVVYAGAAGVVLEPTAGNNSLKIEAALDKLHAGGSTNGGAGIQLAYNLAKQNYQPDGINRVILATDGDFNVGVTSIEALKKLIKKQRQSGIELTTLGVGTGNYNDALMNELAELGNGNASYIDTVLEARKALVEELSSTLFTIAKDVKIQLEFSPQVAEYRLIGYESRLLNREDFNNDKVDAGEIGAGHTVTALYEIVLADSNARTIDPLRYQGSPKNQEGRKNELGFLKLRYKMPSEKQSKLIEQPITRDGIKTTNNTSNNFRWSAATAAFAQQLADSDWIGEFSYGDTLALAKSAVGKDTYGYRAEMVQLVRAAETLKMANVSAIQTEQALAR